MFRLALLPALAGALLLAPLTPAADPSPSPVEKQLAVQSAMANGRKLLDANQPAEAVAALEKEVANADGGKAFLSLLREAYTAELQQLEKAPNPDLEKVAQTRRRLSLLNGDLKTVSAPLAPPAVAPPEPNLGPSLVAPVVEPPSAPPAPAEPAPSGGLRAPLASAAADAIAAFKKDNFAEASRLFADLGAAKLTADQKAAWAYCRIKLSADRVNAPGCDTATAALAAQDVSDALQLIPQNAELLKVGRQVLKAAEAKAGPASGGRKPSEGAVPVATGDAVETASFRVVHGGNRELGEAVAKAAEAARKQIFERWSGPPGGAWGPKCDIVVHATADAYAKATGKPAALTGHASIGLTAGRPTSRRIDLRADDPALVANALPRELTHVVLADLFADKPPPKWALEGMAILAGSPEEIGRYTRTLPRCARENELRPLATLFELKDFPADGITGFYCESVSVTEYLIGLRGERNFLIFLRDAQRYGTAQALKRQYEVNGPQGLEAAWKRASLSQ